MATTEGVQVGLSTKARTEAEPFDAFYRREYLKVVALALAITGDRSTAEDIAQEAFIAAQKHWDRLSRYDAPHAWLRRVATNRSISRIRRLRSESKALDRLATNEQRIAGPGMAAESIELWAAVRSLPKRQAQVIALTYIDGYTVPEVAEILGCRNTTAKTHLKRARATLARKLQLAEEDS